MKKILVALLIISNIMTVTNVNATDTKDETLSEYILFEDIIETPNDALELAEQLGDCSVITTMKETENTNRNILEVDGESNKTCEINYYFVSNDEYDDFAEALSTSTSYLSQSKSSWLIHELVKITLKLTYYEKTLTASKEVQNYIKIYSYYANIDSLDSGVQYKKMNYYVINSGPDENQIKHTVTVDKDTTSKTVSGILSNATYVQTTDKIYDAREVVTVHVKRGDSTYKGEISINL